MEVGAPGSMHRPLLLVASPAASGTCAPASTAVLSHLAGGGGSAALRSHHGLRSLMVRGRSRALPRVPPPPPAAPLPSLGAVLRVLKVLEGVQGHRRAEPRPAGRGQLAAGEAGSGGGGDCARALEAGWREREGRRLAAPTEQATVWFSDSCPDYEAGAEILTDVKCYFSSGNDNAVNSACFTFSYFYLLDVDSQGSGIVLSRRGFLTQHLYNFGDHFCH